jgi:hypothetical protein
MKKARYTLSVEYDNGDLLRQPYLTQARAYRILKAYEDKGWIYRPIGWKPLRITRWKLSTGWQETE